jgi:protoporphyrin/coproporphyrin ferrochelatase
MTHKANPADIGPADRTDTAALLLNLGTPAAPTPAAVRRYLAEFLGDRHVIDYPRWLWLPLLHGVILRVRPARSARAYAAIWTPQGSPLLVNSRKLTQKVAAAGARQRVRVELAMTYGEPSIAAALERLLADGVKQLVLVPLYPQFSVTSTSAAIDRVSAALRQARPPLQVRSVRDYHAAPEYIDALAVSVEDHWRERGRGNCLMLSFHGIPQRYADAGDPYADQCRATAELLRCRLDLAQGEFVIAFQSRVGREPWLKPYTEDLLAELAGSGVRHLQVLCPGFSVDCLETLEEIAMRGRDRFLAAGGQRFDYIPALNDSDAQVALLHALIERSLRGPEDGVKGHA